MSIHKISYDAGFWHGKQTNELRLDELDGYANACILSMLDTGELPAALTGAQALQCEESWRAGFLSGYETATTILPY